MNISTKNLLLSIKNASSARIPFIFCKKYRSTLPLLEELYEQGFILSYTYLKISSKIFIALRYLDNQSLFDSLKLLGLAIGLRSISLLELSKFFNKKVVLFLTTTQGYTNSFFCRRNKISGKTLFIC
jgi:ribosomal protein S8